MAHGLTSSTDMIWSGTTPWHSHGIRMEADATIEAVAAMPQFSWKAEKVQLHLPDGRPVDGTYAMIRSDSGDVIGRSVGDKYTALQFPTAFGFLEQIVTRKEAVIHTAGLLHNGSKVWILAKMPGEIKVHGEDVIGKFLLISNSHDGTTPVQIAFTPIRVVCQNTLRAAIRGAENVHAIRHTKGINQAVQDAAAAMGIANSYYEELGEAYRALQRKEMTFTESVEYINTVFESEAANAEKGSSRAKNILDGVYSLLETGMGMDIPGVRGTAWAAYNAVTEYTDHHKNYRTTDSQLENAAFGGLGVKIKQRALDLALAL
jgi:phage/plasmid-like protein (TIGR03299 family)